MSYPAEIARFKIESFIGIVLSMPGMSATKQAERELTTITKLIKAIDIRMTDTHLDKHAKRQLRDSRARELAKLSSAYDQLLSI
jgi:hypothetical protein